MSPEQARGKEVDRRADIWAFGCVLYEMLAGRQAFPNRETAADTLASILVNEPDWQALPAGTPAKIRALLERCLRKDERRRWADIANVRVELLEARTEREASTIAAAAPIATPSRRRETVSPRWRCFFLSLLPRRFGCFSGRSPHRRRCAWKLLHPQRLTTGFSIRPSYRPTAASWPFWSPQKGRA
jgi:serine/threonine protein kinase